MKKALKSDKTLVLDIVSEAFDTNPGVNSVVKNDKRRKKRIRALANYAFETAYMRDGVFISSDGQGTVISYLFNVKKNSFKDFRNKFVLAFTSVGITRIGKVIRRDKYIKSQRPESGNYVYIWFIGVQDNGKGRGAFYEMKNALLDKADELNLPIYLETSLNRNKLVYSRYGFEAYHKWENEDGYSLWFMKREPGCRRKIQKQQNEETRKEELVAEPAY